MIYQRYTFVRLFYKQYYTISGDVKKLIATEEIGCKTLKEALDLLSCLNEEEKSLRPYIIDNVNNKKQFL